MTLSKFHFVSGDDITEVNRDLWKFIPKYGNRLRFGDKNRIKWATESIVIIQLYKNALIQLYKGETPRGWLFGGDANQEYILMLKNPDRGEQDYTYGQRLHNQSEENQIENVREALREAIETNIQSNRIAGNIWTPQDIRLKDPPCFAFFQLRTSEKNKISLRIVFRSHDYGNGNFANFGAIIRCFVDEVITPAGGELEELVCVSLSGHIYDTDMSMVDAYVFGKAPSYLRRLMR